MKRLTQTALRRWLRLLLKSGDTPRRTAAAYAVGVFFGFCPFMGLHTVLGLAAAFALGLNRVAVLVGVYSNLPWIVGPWYAGTTAAGAALLGADLPPGFGESLRGLLELSLFRADFWRHLTALMEPLLWPFVVGSTLGALLLAALAYWAALALIDARRQRAARRRAMRQTRSRDTTAARVSQASTPVAGPSEAGPRADRRVS
jgi:uncharacterized protein (DUF2062 family)